MMEFENKPWFCHVDEAMTVDRLEQLTTDFFCTVGDYFFRLKEKVISIFQREMFIVPLTSNSSSPFDVESRKTDSPPMQGYSIAQLSCSFNQETPRASTYFKISTENEEQKRETERSQSQTPLRTPLRRRSSRLSNNDNTCEDILKILTTVSSNISKVYKDPILELSSLERVSLDEGEKIFSKILRRSEKSLTEFSENSQEISISPREFKKHFDIQNNEKYVNSENNQNTGTQVLTAIIKFQSDLERMMRTWDSPLLQKSQVQKRKYSGEHEERKEKIQKTGDSSEDENAVADAVAHEECQ